MLEEFHKEKEYYVTLNAYKSKDCSGVIYKSYPEKDVSCEGPGDDLDGLALKCYSNIVGGVSGSKSYVCNDFEPEVLGTIQCDGSCQTN